jgi:hypothetical protein
MQEDQKERNLETVETHRPTENPVILDKVQYVYVSYAQLAISSQDFRLAFGDRMPPDGEHVNPVVGLTMSHELAKALLVLLNNNMPKVDALMAKIRDQKESPGSAIDGGES